MTVELSLDDDVFDASRPKVRDDAEARHYDGDAVAWSPGAAIPVYLDPVAAIVHQLLDGQVSMAELADDVHATMGVPLAVARAQLRRVVTLLSDAGLLAGSSGATTHDSTDFDFFVAPPNP